MIPLFKACFAQIISGQVTGEINLAISFCFLLLRNIPLCYFVSCIHYHIQILTNITLSSCM